MYSSSLKPLQMIGGVVGGDGHHRQQLGLAPRLEAESEGLAELQHLFHHLPLLIHLDRVHAAVLALIAMLGDGGFKGAVDLPQAVLQNIRKTDQDREADAAQNERVD